MNDEPRAEGEREEADPSSPTGEAELDLGTRVAGASAWAFGAMGGMYTTKTLANIVLAALLVREHWGIIAILRVFLMAVEMLSDVGIRGSVVYHKKGQSSAFLNTAWTLQIARGFAMWMLCCIIAFPVAWGFERPLLLWMLPICGLEAVNNGFLSVGVFSRQRTMRVGMPIVLEWIGLTVSILASIIWAIVDRSPWALAIGPLVGGVVKTVLSHVLIPEVRLRFQWDSGVARDLIHFAKWVYVGTIASFVAQQFLTLYLGKMVSESILALYWLAWSISVQTSKPLTLIANQVLIPLFAQGGRISSSEHRTRIYGAMHRFLPACLLVVVVVAFACPAFFGLFYREEYHGAGTMGRYIGVVIWFMILQHVPRAAMLSVGNARGVSHMMVANAVVTIGGCVVGYLYGASIGIGALRGAILGNALGNAAGCVVGAWTSHRAGIPVTRPMVVFSAYFVGLFVAGLALDAWLQVLHIFITPALSSLVVTAVMGLPLAPFVWRRTLQAFLAQRKAKAQVTAP